MMFIPQKLEGFDVAEAVGRMLDQPELWWQAVGLFVTHFSGWLDEWQASIGNDAREVKLVHAMRSAAANVGARPLAEAARGLEEVLRARLTDASVTIEPACRQALAAAYLQAWGEAEKAWRRSGWPPVEVD